MEKRIYSESEKQKILEYLDAKQKASTEIDRLIKKHSVKYKDGSIVDNGKTVFLPREIVSKIQSIKSNLEKLKKRAYAPDNQHQLELHSVNQKG